MGQIMGELILMLWENCGDAVLYRKASLNIYSLEELCYYLDKYPDRLEETFFAMELLGWLEQENGQKELAEELRECRKSGAKLADMAKKVLNAAGLPDGDRNWQAFGTAERIRGKRRI